MPGESVPASTSSKPRRASKTPRESAAEETVPAKRSRLEPDAVKLKRKAKADFKSAQVSSAGLALLDSAGQAAWLKAQYTATTKSSFLEHEELTGGSVLKLGDETARLQQQVQQHVPDWQQLCGFARTSRSLASPSILIISASAPRANDLAKLLPDIGKACKVGKLFAKHFKVEEQQAVLKAQGIFVAVGTPNRLLKLADLGDLHMTHLKLLMIDVLLDAKQRTILDIPETASDFWKFYDAHCKTRVTDGECKIALVDAARG
ncbi:hypothetical protein WJX74_006771 [Apatococcus lobatus]|uniref:Protein CMSS1 n=2 Tax=Apatococcus TaxID=904362 RepID=A0AAW1STV0_9CHLO